MAKLSSQADIFQTNAQTGDIGFCWQFITQDLFHEIQSLSSHLLQSHKSVSTSFFFKIVYYDFLIKQKIFKYEIWNLSSKYEIRELQGQRQYASHYVITLPNSYIRRGYSNSMYHAVKARVRNYIDRTVCSDKEIFMRFFTVLYMEVEKNRL